MMKTNIFVGEHSIITINLDHIEAIENGRLGSVVKIYLRSGNSITLTGADIPMFRRAWNKYIESDEE